MSDSKQRSLACVRVRQLVRAEVDGRGSDESRSKRSPEANLKRSRGNTASRRHKILVLEEGGQGALIGLFLNQG